MSEWVPVLVGFGLIALIFAGARIFPRSWFTGELRTWYGARPTGPYLAFTRRDQLRRAALSAIAATVLVASAFALFPLTERFPNESRASLTMEAYTFIAFILGAVAAFAAVLAVLSAIFWRPKRVKLSAAGRRDLGNYLWLLSEGALEKGQWRDFSAVRFEDDSLETLRRMLVERIGAVPRALSDVDVEWLQQSGDRLFEERVQPTAAAESQSK